jgi:hypothetical protein
MEIDAGSRFSFSCCLWQKLARYPNSSACTSLKSVPSSEVSRRSATATCLASLSSSGRHRTTAKKSQDEFIMSSENGEEKYDPELSRVLTNGEFPPAGQETPYRELY